MSEDKAPTIAFCLDQHEFSAIYMALIHPEYITDLKAGEYKKSLQFRNKELANKLGQILHNWREAGTVIREDGVVVMPRFAANSKSYRECRPFCPRCRASSRIICDDGHIANEYFRRNHACPKKWRCYGYIEHKEY